MVEEALAVVVVEAVAVVDVVSDGDDEFVAD